MRMDRPNGVHNEERTFLDRITQLKLILRTGVRMADGPAISMVPFWLAVPEPASARRLSIH